MEYYYAASTNGFYLPDDPNKPFDAKKISEGEWISILSEQASGKKIGPDGDGKPIAVDPLLASDQ